MFHGLSSNSRHFSCTEDPGIYTSISWGGEAGRESSHIFFLCFQQVCCTGTSLDSSNYHYCLSNLQGFLNIVGLLETESLGVAWGLLKYIKKRSGHFIGVDRRSVLEGRMQASSLQSVQQREERQLDSPIFHCSYFSAPHYFKDCACKHLIQLSTENRTIYTQVLCIWCTHVPEMLFKLNCSLKAAAFHTSTIHPPQGLKPSPQLWATIFKAAKATATLFPGKQDEEESYFNHNHPQDIGLQEKLSIFNTRTDFLQEVVQCSLLQELLGKYSTRAHQHQQPSSVE